MVTNQVHRHIRLSLRPIAVALLALGLTACLAEEDLDDARDLDEPAGIGPTEVQSPDEESIPVEGEVCGDNVAEGLEPCDGTDLDGQSCSSVDASFVGGTLACWTDCSDFNPNACLVAGELQACNYNSQCPATAPFCRNHQCRNGSETDPCTSDNHCSGGNNCVSSQCWDGSSGDPCVYDDDCGTAPFCYAGHCSIGGVGDACLYDNDCAPGSPYCSDGFCSAGNVGDSCLYNTDCSPGAAHCALGECSEGNAGDPCEITIDCSAEAPFCGGGVCAAGEEGDPCDDWDGDCGPTAPLCVIDTCYDGGVLDPCHHDGDCSAAAPFCADSTNSCSNGSTGSDCLYNSECLSGVCISGACT
ncbi:hypothetical protein ACNOYE_04150 [Nannocystaceae bacterium ST9]